MLVIKLKKINGVTRVNVTNKAINPVFNAPIGVKIQSAFIPENRKSINQWFSNFEPQ